MTFVSAADFLRAIFPVMNANEFVELRCLDGNGAAPHVYFEHDIGESLLAAAVAERTSRNVYIGCAVRVLDDCPHCRATHRPLGDAAHSGKLGVLWADVDAKCFGGILADALSALLEAPLPPSIIVESGHGYHAWWVLDEAAIGAELVQARQTMEAIRRTLGLRAAQPLDDVSDLPRILRLPNTLNHKDSPALPVRIVVFEPERRYGLRELADAYSVGETDEAEQSGERSYEVGGVDPEMILIGVSHGERDETLWRYACWLRRENRSLAEARALVLTAARACRAPAGAPGSDPFPDAEAVEKVERAYRTYPAGETGTHGEALAP